MSDVVIVKAGADRLDELEPLWNALGRHHHRVMPSFGALRDRADSWARRRAHYGSTLGVAGAFLLVAERNGTAVGYAMVSVDSPSHTWAIDSGATLETIVVMPELRGTGLGSALLDRVTREVREAGMDRLGLGVVAANDDAIRFYRRHGFVPAFIEMTKPL